MIGRVGRRLLPYPAPPSSLLYWSTKSRRRYRNSCLPSQQVALTTHKKRLGRKRWPIITRLTSVVILVSACILNHTCFHIYQTTLCSWNAGDYMSQWAYNKILYITYYFYDKYELRKSIFLYLFTVFFDWLKFLKRVTWVSLYIWPAWFQTRKTERFIIQKQSSYFHNRDRQSNRL